ncbi:MAG: hypothetical protein ACRDGT_13650, partial [Candidatus Limnocylindria bacterium]
MALYDLLPELAPDPTQAPKRESCAEQHSTDRKEQEQIETRERQSAAATALDLTLNVAGHTAVTRLVRILGDGDRNPGKPDCQGYRKSPHTSHAFLPFSWPQSTKLEN